MDFPEGVGPHNERELELMLQDKKHLAWFADVIPENGEIVEDIIPEKAFAPHVASGRIIRLSRDVRYSKPPCMVRQVAFTNLGHEWRAHTAFWLHDRKMDESDDILMGRLLGYAEEDIKNFLQHQKRILNLK